MHREFLATSCEPRFPCAVIHADPIKVDAHQEIQGGRAIYVWSKNRGEPRNLAGAYYAGLSCDGNHPLHDVDAGEELVHTNHPVKGKPSILQDRRLFSPVASLRGFAIDCK